MGLFYYRSFLEVFQGKLKIKLVWFCTIWYNKFLQRRNIMYKFEPILISYEDKEWQHPDIMELVKLYSEPCGYNGGNWYIKNLIRIWLRKDSQLVHIVAICEDDFYISFNESMPKSGNMTKEESKEFSEEFIGLLQVILFEDVWSPGEQFCFSEFGESIQHFLHKDASISWSPDIGVGMPDKEGGKWGFGS